METIQELRTMLQEEKIHPDGWSRPLGYKTFQRGPSIYITRLLLPTGITPNQVTVAGIILGCIGCLMLFQFDVVWKIKGLFFIYLNILSDKVDGEMARYRKTYSLQGIYWDEINHLTVPPLFWLALMFGISKVSIFEMRPLFIVGFLGALALVIIRVTHSLAPQIFAKKYIKHPEWFTQNPQKVEKVTLKQDLFMRILKTPVRVLHQFQDFFVLTATTFILVILELTLARDYAFHPYIALYVMATSVLLMVFAIESIVRKARSVERTIYDLGEQILPPR